MRFQLGDLATWAGSVVTVGVLSVALWQLGILRKDREAEQAALVSAWISGTPTGCGPDDPNPTVTVALSFRNVSNQPISRILHQVTLGSQRHRGSTGPIPPDGSIRTKDVPFRSIPLEDAQMAPTLDIWFTDEAGHQWHRPHAGRLKESAPPRDWSELRIKIGPVRKSALMRQRKSIEVRVVDEPLSP